MKISGNTILITGGGSGIGAALARNLHDRGNTVIVAGRRLGTLETACQGRTNMHPATLDITDDADITRFAHEIVTHFPALNVLVNNAGIMRFEALDHTRGLDDAEATITTNLLGPIRLTNALTDHLRAQANATLINVTSGLAFVPLTTTPTYNATKAAIHSYTIALREQLRGKIEVIELAPPAVQTDLTPGQSTRAGYMPLGDYIDETLFLLSQEPTPAEILVERVRPLRFAEANGTFDKTLDMLNTMAQQAGTARN